MTPTTQHQCPLACGWTHDQGVPNFNDVAGGTVEEVVHAGLMRQYAAEEIIVRAHLETRSLLEWVTAVTELQREKAELQQRLDDIDWPEMQKIVSAEMAARQRCDWHNAGRCPMCGGKEPGGWLCDACQGDVRRMDSRSRRPWRRFERPHGGVPLQGTGYTPAGLLGIDVDGEEQR